MLTNSLEAAVAQRSAAPPTPAAITVRGLRKRYDNHEAVRGIDLEIRRGEVFAFLGPNGAGKTTTVEILEGFREATAGEVTVLGADPAHAPAGWRDRLGIVLQESAPDPGLTVRESVQLYAGYYRAPLATSEVLGLVDLTDQADQRATALSGGQRRRLDVALALVGDPELIFLDEPTTGFDPNARRAAWDVIDGLRRLGKTVFLTTHYMEEAERLADRIAVIADGVIVAEGTPKTLGGRNRAAAQITYTTPDGPVTVSSTNVAKDLHEISGWALDIGVELEDLEVRRPTLEDVYLDLTNHKEQTR